MIRQAAVLLAVLPGAALASTPPGTLRQAPVYTDYPTRSECEAAIAARAASDRAQAAQEPNVSVAFAGPSYDGGEDRLTYTMTRIATVAAPGVVARTAYIYEHVCEGSRYRFVADGWVSHQMPPPPPPR